MPKTPLYLTLHCTQHSEHSFSQIGSDRLTREEREDIQRQVRVYLDAYVRDGPFDELLETQIEHIAYDRQSLPAALLKDPEFLAWWCRILQEALANESKYRRRSLRYMRLIC